MDHSFVPFSKFLTTKGTGKFDLALRTEKNRIGVNPISFLSCMIFSTYLGSFFLIVAWGLLIKSVLSLWLNDFFFFFVLSFGLSSIVRTRRHTSREVSGIGEISILDSAKEKERLKFSINQTVGHLAEHDSINNFAALLGKLWGTIGALFYANCNGLP